MHIKKILISLLLLGPLSISGVQARNIFQSEFYSEQQGAELVIDAGNDVAGDLAVTFGGTAQSITWDITSQHFHVSNDLSVAGNVDIGDDTVRINTEDTGDPDNDVNIIAYQGSESPGTLRYDDGNNRWEVSNNGGAFVPLVGNTSIFSGPGGPGLVPDPFTSGGRFLRDDGTWAELQHARDIGFVQINGGFTGTLNVTSVGFQANFVDFTLNNDIEAQNFDSISPINQNSEQGSFGWGQGYAFFNGSSIDQQAQFFSASSNSINAHRAYSSNNKAIMVIASDQNGNVMGRIEGTVTAFTPSGFTLNITTNTMLANYVMMYNASVASGTEIQFIDHSTSSNTFTLDDDNSGGNIALQFGATLAEQLRWNAATGDFELTDDLNFLGNQLKNGRIENSASAPATCSGTQTGRLYFNTTDSKLYYCDGTSWKESGSGAGVSGALPAAQARRTTNFTIPALNTWTDVPLDTTDLENAPGSIDHLAGTNDRIQVYESGLYQVFYSVNHNTGLLTHQLSSRVRVNDTTPIPGSLTETSNFQNEFTPNSRTVITQLNAGDFITLQVSRSTTNEVTGEPVLNIVKLQGIKGDPGAPGTSVYTGATAPFACVAPLGGSLWFSSVSGQTFVCDTSNGRNAWLSQSVMTLYGESNGTCNSGQNAGSSDGCNVDWGDGLGADTNTDLGLFMPYNITVVGFGFSDDNESCNSGSYDVEIYTTPNASDDNNYSFDANVASGLTTSPSNGINLNVPITGNRYMIWGIDNNCGQNIDDWNVILYYRIRGG